MTYHAARWRKNLVAANREYGFLGYIPQPQEIAEILEISVGNVKVRPRRARKKLKTILEEECKFEVDERNVLICDPVASKK